MNAATYATGGVTGNGIAPGSLAVVFGLNLASGTYFPDQLLVPTRLGGTSVLVGGIPTPLMYVSPTQIDFQMPMSVTGPTTLVVTTPSGSSRPYPLNAVDAFGVFTSGAGGCGTAAALNTGSDGTLSLNTPSTSISPGETLAIFGTGLYPVSPAPQDGIPASSNPLSVYTGAKGGTTFDLNGPYSPHAFAGMAAGLVGVDQINIQVPDNAREGCAVPLLISTGANGNTKPVTVSIQRGGGPCSDPAAAGYGQIEWVKTISTGGGTDIETNTVAISLQASPGKQRPQSPSFAKSTTPGSGTVNLGPQCPVPGYRSLDAGAISAQGPGFGPTDVSVSPLGPPVSGQVAGLTEYFAVLPRGAVQAGSFTVTAKGGADVPAFQSSLQIGAGIDIATPLVQGTVLHRQSPLVVNWTGGDAAAWVTLKLVVHYGPYDRYSFVQAPAADGGIIMPPDGFADLPAGPIEIVLEVQPEKPSSLAAPALSLGGENTWKYIYRFAGIKVD